MSKSVKISPMYFLMVPSNDVDGKVDNEYSDVYNNRL